MQSAKLLFSHTMSVCRGAFLFVVLFSCAINLLMLTAPIYMLQVFDRILSSRSEASLITLLMIAIFAILVMASLEAVRSFLLIKIGGWLDERLGSAVFAGQVTQAVDGDPSAQSLRDLATVRGFITGPTVFPILDAPWTPVFIAALFFLHPHMGALATGGAAVIFALAILNELLTRGPLGRAGHLTNTAMTAAEQAARNADVIQAMGMMDRIQARWRPINDESLRLQNIASDRSALISSTSKFVRLGLQIGIMTLGAYLVIHDQLTAGAMIAGSILMGRALAPVEQAIGSWKQAIMARDSYRRLRKHIAQTDVPDDAMPLPSPTGQLSVQGIGYFHHGHEEPAVNQVSFALEAGDQLGIVGPTASGKTTLARMLVGNLRPKVGHVRLDGMNIFEWDKGNLGPHLGYVPQDVELFPGTIAENIARLAEPDPELTVKAAQDAGVHELILSFPNGYEYEIGEGGRGLSGGQKQRIALARALYGDVKFLVLDEPNANLDGQGEASLRRALKTSKERGITTVIIAHRPTTMGEVDHLLVMKKGRVDAFGPRDEVLASLKPKRSTQRPQIVKTKEVS